MQINITLNIDDRIIKFFKGLLTRRNIVAVIIVTVIGSSMYLYATISTDYSLHIISGQPISSTQVLANFDDFKDAINVNETAISANASNISDATGDINTNTTNISSMTSDISALQSTRKVYDSDESADFGHLLSASADGLVVLTTTGYICGIDWRGEVKENFMNTIYWGGGITNCNNDNEMHIDMMHFGIDTTPMVTSDIPIALKGVFKQQDGSGKIFIPEVTTSDFTISNASGGFSYSSRWMYLNGSCTTSGGNISGPSIQVQGTTASGVGLPTTNVDLPLIIKEITN